MNLEKKDDSFKEIYKLFQEDLRSQLALFSQVILDLNKEDFLDLHYSLLTRITRSLNASSKIVQLSPLNVFILAFESYLTFLKENHKTITSNDKESIKNVYSILKEINQIPENDLSNFIAKQAGICQKIIEKFHAREKEEVKIEEQKIHLAAPEKKMLELFRDEMETQIKVLSEGLLFYQHNKENLKVLDPLMRAAHSIKGAAKVFSFESIVQLAHLMEDAFIATKEKKIILDEENSEILFLALDAMAECIKAPATEITWNLSAKQKKLNHLTDQLKKILKQEVSANLLEKQKLLVYPELKQESVKEENQRVLKLTAQNLNRLMGLSAESLVEARWLKPFCDSLLRLKNGYNLMFNQLEALKSSFDSESLKEINISYFHALNHTLNEYHNQVTDRINELEMFITRHSHLTDRLYSEVIESRMRPLADGIEVLPRMIWETARHLHKKARLKIEGQSTLIDREILEKLEIPLGHILRNAVDHGIETPEERINAGKSPEGLVVLKASHKAGLLSITISDDGRGADIEALRQKIVKDKLASEKMASKFSEQEILNFLFLPGFSTSEKVTDISGRGVGLDIVQNMLQEVSGSIQIENHPGKGMSFNLLLPLTLSVIRALITKIDSGIFAFPLAHIEQAVTISKEQIQHAENREYFIFNGFNVGLVPAAQIFNLECKALESSTLPVVILQNRNHYYGIIVDEFLGEKELVLQDIETRLGKIPCIASGSVLENGDPILILDIEDLIGSIDKFLSTGKIYRIQYEEKKTLDVKKRILVVDDSISVREVECRLLKNQGYLVDGAVNGVEAWNAVRLGDYNLVVTDVDMPRMNGIELTRNIKNDARLKTIPVLIVSYKERDSDRLLGLEAGADYYFEKSTFGDDTLIRAVVDLIGAP